LNAYADTSFLVSLYTPDTHSEAAAVELVKTELPLLLTSFGELELTNALQLRIFRKEITLSKMKASLALFRSDLSAGVYFLKPLSEPIFERALRLARKHTRLLGTRTLDILHVASALDLKAKTFYTFDQRQKKLAHS
jgi:predicted nucleic acid-binding protein